MVAPPTGSRQPSGRWKIKTTGKRMPAYGSRTEAGCRARPTEPRTSRSTTPFSTTPITARLPSASSPNRSPTMLHQPIALKGAIQTTGWPRIYTRLRKILPQKQRIAAGSIQQLSSPDNTHRRGESCGNGHGKKRQDLEIQDTREEIQCGLRDN